VDEKKGQREPVRNHDPGEATHDEVDFHGMK
jgi:hypothetical protein